MQEFIQEIEFINSGGICETSKIIKSTQSAEFVNPRSLQSFYSYLESCEDEPFDDF
jgi:hypothetical protein